MAPLFTFTPFIAAVSNLSQSANALSGSIAGFNVANISFKLNTAGAAGASGVTAASLAFLAISSVLVFIAPGEPASTPNPAVAAAAVPFVQRLQ